MEKKIKNQKFEASSRSHSEGLLWVREKTMWRQKQRNLPIGEKVALLGQTILETLELEKIKRHAKGL
ncbi:MAG: hypothetical protein NTZ94_00695 [Verrucomicrobia bacterium]|nr:hypothetical protein [Verrucomicrobiota bacterium]